MPKKLHKNLKLYFSKLKKIRTLWLTNPPTTNSLLSACKYPRTPSTIAADRCRRAVHGDDEAATLPDVDCRSPYIHDDDTDDDDDDDNDGGHPPIRPSNRFFVSLGTSNSMVDEARTNGTSSSLLMTSSSSSDPGLAVPGDSVAVMMFSKDPYDDFRRSMQDMVESWHADPRQGLDWDFMEELLFCYLELNDCSMHKHILKAFTDLTAGFRRKVPATEWWKVPASTATRATRRRRRRRRKVCRDLETSTKMAPQGKVKECHYDHRKHVET